MQTVSTEQTQNGLQSRFTVKRPCLKQTQIVSVSDFQTVLPEQTQNGLQSRFTVKRFCKSFSPFRKGGIKGDFITPRKSPLPPFKKGGFQTRRSDSLFPYVELTSFLPPLFRPHPILFPAYCKNINCRLLSLFLRKS